MGQCFRLLAASTVLTRPSVVTSGLQWPLESVVFRPPILGKLNLG